MEGSFINSKVYNKRAYQRVNMEGVELSRNINKKYLKKYYPIISKNI